MKEGRRHLLLDGRWCALRERERRLRNAADVIADSPHAPDVSLRNMSGGAGA